MKPTRRAGLTRAAVVIAFLSSCSSEPGVALSPAACAQLAKVEAIGDRDEGDRDEVEALVALLPDELLDEAALYYYPWGGSVAGLDTSGTNAEKAGRTLRASLERCDD